MINLLIILSVYFVSFTDKPEKTAPQLSERAWAQRQRWNIPTDAMDYPVSPMYMDSLRRMGAKIYHKSRWMNGVTCEMTSTTAQKVAQLRFVQAVEITRDNSTPRSWLPKRRRMPATATMEAASTMVTDRQLSLFNLLPLHQAGYEGQGILMTVCDGGFYNANTLSCFRDSLQLGAMDFTDDTDGFYGSTGEHGTMCLSTISAMTSNYHGAATQAQYYLMRSEENNTESPKEMDNLVAALEAADSLGVNVFSISLGYAMFDNSRWDLSYSDLNGSTTRVSQAATIAAHKGMLVCVAAGNEGNDTWHYISAPADADSILTVGAVTTGGQIADFSSYGPSADGRIKPEVCAVGSGTQLITRYGYNTSSNGTSYATPLIAGLAASLWSALPNENAMQIRERIIRSCDNYQSPDSSHRGYGIPNAWTAYTMNPPLGVENAPESLQEQPRKTLQNGQIRIILHGRVYDLTGRLIE